MSGGFVKFAVAGGHSFSGVLDSVSLHFLPAFTCVRFSDPGLYIVDFFFVCIHSLVRFPAKQTLLLIVACQYRNRILADEKACVRFVIYISAPADAFFFFLPGMDE